MKVGRRTLISAEAAKEWRARMEEAALTAGIKTDTTEDAKMRLSSLNTGLALVY